MLVNAREIISPDYLQAKQGGRYRRCLQWFCDEVEFLGYEYRAREEAAAAILGRGLVKNIRPRVVKVKVGKERMTDLRRRKDSRGEKERSMKLKLRLWKDAVEE